jgi:tetratricopeptide (TPR) repeat protein
MTRARLGFALVASVLLLATPLLSAHAAAQTPTGEGTDDEARRHFRLGQAHYDNGDFAEAATEFDEAYRLSQRPQLLYNVYVAYRDAGDLPHAAAALRSYLEQVPDAENAAQLRARLTSMDRVLAASGTTTTTTATPTDTTTDTTTATTTDTATTDTTTTDTTTSTMTDTTTTTSSGGGFGSSPVGWIVGGIGAAMVVAGIGTGAAALGAQSSLDGMCGADHHSCPVGFESQRDSGRALAIASDVMLIGGAVVLGTGVILLFVLTEGGTADEPPVSASCGTDGCSAFVHGSF